MGSTLDPTDAFTRVWDFISDIWTLIITVLVEDFFLTIFWDIFVDIFLQGVLTSIWAFALLICIFLWLFHSKYIGRLT